MKPENNEANQIVDRLKDVYKVTTDTALGAELGVTKHHINNWRSRNSPPYEICLAIAKEKNIDLNWLLTGKGDMYRNQLKEQSPSYQSKSIGALEQLFDRVETLEQQLSEMRKQA
jgi:hypothetical protein